MVVNFMVKFVGPVGRFDHLASTVVPADEDESGVNTEALQDHIVGYLHSAGLSSRHLRVEAIVTTDEGSGTIYQGERRIGTCRLIRMEAADAD